MAIAIPVGIWAGRNPRVDAFLSPILDALQTIPSFVFIIPVVLLFTLGQVPGIIAAVLYAIVPGIRITALGIREVPEESVEASQTFGATQRQTMFGVQDPAGRAHDHGRGQPGDHDGAGDGDHRRAGGGRCAWASRSFGLSPGTRPVSGSRSRSRSR